MDTWEAQRNIMIDQPQIFYILKTGLQRTINIVPKVALSKFLKYIYIYIVCYIFFEIVNVFVLKTRIGALVDHKENKYKK